MVIQRIDVWPAILLLNFSEGIGRCKLPALTSPRSSLASRRDSIRAYSLARSCESAKVNVHVSIGHHLAGLWNLWRRLVLSKEVEKRSLTSLQQRLVRWADG